MVLPDIPAKGRNPGEVPGCAVLIILPVNCSTTCLGRELERPLIYLQSRKTI
jgi:hypothetical protein